MQARKVAFLFPGQGSQFVGMGKKLAEVYATAREAFQQVDEALGQHLSKIIFAGQAEDLALTSNTQPALMATSIAALRVLQTQAAIKPALLAGHSLGEYSAYAAADSFSIEDTARLLRARGDAMQSAVKPGEGGMIALLACEIGVAEQICADASTAGLCQVANDNGAGQIVISGEVAAMNFVLDNAKNYPIKRAVSLPVSAPFHCKLMGPAAKTMDQKLSEVTTRDPKVPVLANVSVTEIVRAEDIRPTLVAQVAGRVRWRESMDYMIAAGIDTFIEIGAGKTLCNLMSRVNSEVRVFNILEPESFDALMNVL